MATRCKANISYYEQYRKMGNNNVSSTVGITVTNSVQKVSLDYHFITYMLFISNVFPKVSQAHTAHV
jgi:hypothetical protein